MKIQPLESNYPWVTDLAVAVKNFVATSGIHIASL